MPTKYPNRLVWTEIPVTDMKRAKAFYETVLEEPLVDMNDGPNPMSMLPNPGESSAAGHIYPGKPAPKGEGVTVHLSVLGELKDAMARVTKGGGEVISEIITIPTGSFFYAFDPDGNSVGFFRA